MKSLPLTKKYIPAILLIATFVIINAVLSNQMIKSNDEYGKIINISGKQRMLSQRLVIVADSFFSEQNKTNLKVLKNTIQELEVAHKYLLTKVFNKELETIYFREDLDKNLAKYLSNFHKLIDTKDESHLLNARLSSKDILTQLDKAVKEYEKHLNHQLKTLSEYEFYLMMTTLFVLFLTIVFIFIPTAKKIENDTKILLEREEYEATVIESNNNAVVAIDWTGKVTTFNKKAEKIFGWSKEEMLGTRNLTKLIPKKYHDAHNKSSKRYLETGVSSGIISNTHELEGVRKDGTIFPLRISFGAKWKPQNAIVVANIVDISKEKEQQNMLIQQSKMASMGEMIGNIAHQWRQPLSAISTSASGTIVEKELGLLNDEELKVRLREIVSKTEYLSQTIEDFRHFFKESKEKEEFQINSLINNVENIIGSTYKNSHISLFKDYDESIDINCEGYANELSQVLINIFNNAKDILVEKDCEDKVVKVSLLEVDGYIVINIYDSAGGIPDDILPKIFEPYFTTKHQAQGTGIGLYMSSEIINNHFNGQLSVKNTNFTVNGKEYKGPCFTIKIPSNI